uniref:Uncharacterized protein n=1 Tax=Caenorhabditis tropicalis TaxID=1561998 RepID=A0A1I7UHG4_9PELO
MNRFQSFLMADTYINLGEIQTATNESSDGSQGAVPTAKSNSKSGPSGIPSDSIPHDATPYPSAPPPVQVVPPPPPAETALAVIADSPPREPAAPISIKPVHAPALKLFNDVNFDSEAKSSQQKVGSRKASKKSSSEKKKKRRTREEEDDDEKTNKKPKQFYFARGCYAFCFVFFMAILVLWALAAFVALSVVHLEFFEKMFMNFG